MPDEARAPFTISDDLAHPPLHIVRMTGELDTESAPQLRRRLLTLLDDGQVNITVDLDGLEFMDSAGLGVLVSSLKRARALDGEITLICSNRHRLQLFSITGLDSVFTIYDSDQAIPDDGPSR